MLEQYQKKRDFSKTTEPKGTVKKSGSPIFVVQEHHATHLHYDLRLEIGGVLKSWAVPKLPPTEKGVKRLAVQTENHPLEYAEFKGVIPEGQYGAGTVKIWDKGKIDFKKISDDKIEFTLHGKKLKGSYVLIKFQRAGEKNWLFFKV